MSFQPEFGFLWAVRATRPLRGRGPGRQQQDLFEPDSSENLLEGWLIHARKQRSKHEECARRYESAYQAISLPATGVSALTTLPAVASLAQAQNAPPLLIGATTAFAVASAVLVGFQKNGEYDKMAESHRSAEFNYKDAVRKIESAFAAKDFNDQIIQNIEERLRVVDGQAPLILPAVDDLIEHQAATWTVKTDLAKPCGDDSSESPGSKHSD